MSDNKSVLIVEDEFLIAMDLEASLEDYGYQIVGPASSVEQAMKMIECETVNAAVLDYNLKDGTSEPIALYLMSQSIPVIFLSGGSLRDRSDALKGCLVLSKPVSFLELDKALKVCIKK